VDLVYLVGDLFGVISIFDDGGFVLLMLMGMVKVCWRFIVWF